MPRFNSRVAVQVGSTVDCSYNNLDQRSQTTDSRGDTDDAYDEFDRIAQVDTPEGTLNYEYDNYGRTSRVYADSPSDHTHDWTYSYDSLGRFETGTTVERNDVVLSTQ